MKNQKNLVNTPGADGVISPITYMRNEKGMIDLEAYKGLEGRVTQNNLTVNVKITDARIRYGHLDLCVTPVAGEGTVWVERKNIVIPEDKSAKRKTTNRIGKMSFVADEYNRGAISKQSNMLSTDELRAMIKALVAENAEIITKGKN